MWKQLLGAAFVLGILPSILFARDGIRVFTDSSLEDPSMIVSCAVIDGLVSTDCLGERAYDIARDTGALSLVPASNQTETSYVDLFKRWNGLGETMTSSRFMRKATGTGFYLPQGEGRAAPLRSDEWLTIQADIGLLKQQMRALTPENPTAIANLQLEVAKLREQLVGVDASTAGLMGTLDTLKGVLDSYPSLLQSELDAQTKEIGDRLSNFETRMDAVESDMKTKVNVSDFDEALKQVNGRIDNLSSVTPKENGPSVRWDHLAVVIALLSLLLGLGLLWFKQSKKVASQTATEHTTRVDTLERTLSEASETATKSAQAATNAVSKLTDRVRDVEETQICILTLDSQGRYHCPDLSQKRLDELETDDPPLILEVVGLDSRARKVEVTKGVGGDGKPRLHFLGIEKGHDFIDTISLPALYRHVAKARQEDWIIGITKAKNAA